MPSCAVYTAICALSQEQRSLEWLVLSCARCLLCFFTVMSTHCSGVAKGRG